MSKDGARDPLFIPVSELGGADDSPVLLPRPTLGWKSIRPAGQDLSPIPPEQELAFAQMELQAAQGRLQAAQRERQAAERKLRAVRDGAAKGRRKGHETKRAGGEELLAAVLKYRAKHPSHGRPAIARALLPDHGRQFDHADPEDEARAIRTLTKRIERLEKHLKMKSLDT